MLAGAGIKSFRHALGKNFTYPDTATTGQPVRKRQDASGASGSHTRGDTGGGGSEQQGGEGRTQRVAAGSWNRARRAAEQRAGAGAGAGRRRHRHGDGRQERPGEVQAEREPAVEGRDGGD